jgi:hypothetical protein
MPTKTWFYIIRPKSELLELIKQFPKSAWDKPEIMTVPVTSDIFPDKENFYASVVKVSLLLKIIGYIRTPAIQRLNPSFIELVKVLFGEPQVFSIQKIDNWWEFEHVDLGLGYDTIISMVSLEDLSLLQAPTDERISKWLSSMSQKLSKKT